MEKNERGNKGKNVPKFMSTHPSPDNRIKKINEWIYKIMMEYPPIEKS